MANGASGQSEKPPSAVATPSRNAIDEMWPSPTVRSDRTKRTAPSRTPVWSGCGTMDGFMTAAAA